MCWQPTGYDSGSSGDLEHRRRLSPRHASSEVGSIRLEDQRCQVALVELRYGACEDSIDIGCTMNLSRRLCAPQRIKGTSSSQARRASCDLRFTATACHDGKRELLAPT